MLGLLPWLALALVLAGWQTAAALVFFLLVVTGLGYLPLTAIGFLPSNVKLRLAFAPAGGFILLAAYFGIAARLGVGIAPVFVLFSALGMISAAVALRNLARYRSGSVPGGMLLVLVSMLIAVVFYRPGLEMNGVQLADGRYSWIDGDASYDTSVAASIKMGSPVRMPGMYEAELAYHYGAYAISAFLSVATGLELAAALKVLHGLGLTVLFLAAIGCSSTFGKILGDRHWERRRRGGSGARK